MCLYLSFFLFALQIVHDFEVMDCWAQNGSTFGCIFMTFKGQFLREGQKSSENLLCLFSISLWSIGPYSFFGLAPNKNNWSTTYNCNLSLSHTDIHTQDPPKHTHIHTHTHMRACIHETHQKDPSDYSLCFNDKWRCIDKRRNCMTRVTRKLVSRSSDNKLTQDCVVVTGPASHYMNHINIHVQKNTKKQIILQMIGDAPQKAVQNAQVSS